jgi:NADH-quinone oxidoreductase subunit D
MREMDESVYMIRQLMDMLPTARSTSTTAAARARRKTLVYSEIESLINHFKLIMDWAPPCHRGGVCRARGAERRARLLLW